MSPLSPDRAADAEQQRGIRELIAYSLQILRASLAPDTFLGRKTQEPFPQEDAQPGVDAASKKLLPPQ